MTMEELEKTMVEHGAVLRAVPLKTVSIFEPCHKDKYPDGRIRYVEELGREMLVVERIPEHAGKFMVETARHTSPIVYFTKRYFDHIEDAVEALASGNAGSPVHTVQETVPDPKS